MTSLLRHAPIGLSAALALAAAPAVGEWSYAFRDLPQRPPPYPRARHPAKPEPVLRHVAIAKAKKKRAAKQARRQRRKS